MASSVTQCKLHKTPIIFKEHWLPVGITSALMLLYIATLFYPGGSQYDANEVGFDRQNNYLRHLFNPKGVNDLPNTSRIWAIGGVFFLSVSFGLFFIHFSKKIPLKSASNIIKYFGIGVRQLLF